jgi:hypothetical protein
MYGVYVNGNKQVNLKSNSGQRDFAGALIDTIMREQVKYPDAKIIFTDKEEDFKSGLPSFEEYMGL